MRCTVLDKLTTEVDCSFFLRRTAELKQIEVRVPTGGSGSGMRLRQACQVVAEDFGWSHWAMPDLTSTAGSWIVYLYARRMAFFRARMPTREAAEMWMLHAGKEDAP